VPHALVQLAGVWQANCMSSSNYIYVLLLKEMLQGCTESQSTLLLGVIVTPECRRSNLGVSSWSNLGVNAYILGLLCRFGVNFGVTVIYPG